MLPIEAGILVNGEKQILVMETHFDNHDLIEGNIDNSGVKVYYTDTMREHEAGSLLIGDSMLGRFGDVVKTDFEYENTCPSECTSKFKKSINIYSSLSHMHTTGKEIYTNVHAKNETYLRNMNKVSNCESLSQRSLSVPNEDCLRSATTSTDPNASLHALYLK